MNCRRPLLAALVGVAALLVAGCGGGDEITEVVLVTHDSFAVSKPVHKAFEQETGYTLRILQSGDAGQLVNTSLLTAGKPQADVLFGIDDNLLRRALDGELFNAYASPELHSLREPYTKPDIHVTPVDHGEVCLNIDRSWFATHDVAVPTTLEDLTRPAYKSLLVVENPATSSPGLAFLFATTVRYGDAWEAYWRKLRANDVLVTDGWETAYTQQFSGAAGSPGTRPIVVSYATSPAAEVIFAGKPLTESPTAVVEDGCFRQVEYAGVLRGAKNVAGARALIDFLLGERFQTDVASSMFVFPVRQGILLPEAFVKHAIVPATPYSYADIATGGTTSENRDRWIAVWTDIVLR